MDLAVQVYRLSLQYPETVRYSLADQLRRAGTSVPLNIAEGCGCATDGEFAHFLGYSYRSLNEVGTCVELGERLFPRSGEGQQPLLDETLAIQRMTYALMSSLRANPRRTRYGQSSR